MNHRTRLNDEERLYLISLVEADNNIKDNDAKAAFIGEPIRRLLSKLGDTTRHPEMSRARKFKEVVCEECSRTFKSGAGLSRHLASKLKAQQEEV